jgi:hypothetical protein
VEQFLLDRLAMLSFAGRAREIWAVSFRHSATAIPAKVITIGARRAAMSIAAARNSTNRLPRFSTSSSKGSVGNIIAQPSGSLFFRTKRKADRLRKNNPPLCPSAPRATQKPCLF